MVLSRQKKIGVFVAVAAAIVVFLFVSRNIFNTNSLNPLNDVDISETGGSVSGDLVVEDSKKGDGSEAKAGDLVSVHYTGVLEDGTEFDSSYDRGVPIEFTLGAGQVIKGWDQGIVGMKVGGTRTLTIPPELGYGSRDTGPIPGGSTLIFEVELVGIK